MIHFAASWYGMYHSEPFCRILVWDVSFGTAWRKTRVASLQPHFLLQLTFPYQPFFGTNPPQLLDHGQGKAFSRMHPYWWAVP
jgi:hypothetical protein